MEIGTTANLWSFCFWTAIKYFLPNYFLPNIISLKCKKKKIPNTDMRTVGVEGAVNGWMSKKGRKHLEATEIRGWRTMQRVFMHRAIFVE